MTSAFVTEKKSFRNKFIGDKAFYRSVLSVAVPVMVQNGISNFVSMLDNIMVGRVGTNQMSGVSIVNQLIFIYFLCIFGGMGGVSIFTAQYYGNKDTEGIRHTFRYKIWMALILTGLAAVIFWFLKEPLIGLYLNGESEAKDLQETLQYGIGYMDIILLSFPAFMVLQIYASTLRSCGETVLPMKAGIAAVLTNLVFNWLLIFGNLGFPELGVNGAAIATVLSRYVEMSIVVIYVHTHKRKCPWAAGLYKKLSVPKELSKVFMVKGFPLLINECLWSMGMAMLTQCYSLRGLNIIVAFNIANTLNNMLNIVFFAMGDAVSIMVGQLLGAGRLTEAKDKDTKIIFFAVLFSFVTVILLIIIGPFFPNLYNTNAEARAMATSILYVYACFSPVNAFNHCAYFTLRSGGKTWITFLFDSAYTWIISVPVAFVLSRFTGIPAVGCFAIVSACDLIKSVIGYFMVKSNAWVVNLAREDDGKNG